jgi:hypothetical protein
MAGAVLIVVALLLIVVGTMIAGAVMAVALGWALKNDSDLRHEGSELIELNR